MSKDQLEAMSIIISALSKIANGRTDNGRPLAAEISRQLARVTLTSIGVSWTFEKHIFDPYHCSTH